MSSPILVASTDARHQLLVITVEGPLEDPDHVEGLRAVLGVVPSGYRLIVDLTEVVSFSADTIETLRSIARDAVEHGITMIVVCGDLAHRTELVLADLDTLVPVVEAVELALPITRAA